MTQDPSKPHRSGLCSLELEKIKYLQLIGLEPILLLQAFELISTS